MLLSHFYPMAQPTPSPEAPSSSATVQPNPTEVPTEVSATPPEAVSGPQVSYTKLAMRNMVRKKGTSLKHFFLTLVGLLGLLVGLSYLTR
jgi:hypothetical protein